MAYVSAVSHFGLCVSDSADEFVAALGKRSVRAQASSSVPRTPDFLRVLQPVPATAFPGSPVGAAWVTACDQFFEVHAKEYVITKSTGRVLHMAQKPTAKKTVAEDPHYTQALQSYETGLRAMQEHKFDKAKPHFQKVVAGPAKELSDRATVHLSICNQHLERSAATQFKTVEEHFDYAVSLMNIGDYVTAREHFEKLVKQNA